MSGGGEVVAKNEERPSSMLSFDAPERLIILVFRTFLEKVMQR